MSYSGPATLLEIDESIIHSQLKINVGKFVTKCIHRLDTFNN